MAHRDMHARVHAIKVVHEGTLKLFEWGRRDYIIPVLLSGEPETSFPEALRSLLKEGRKVEIEPLAADMRFIDAKLLPKRRFTSEALRIVAQMLGVGYGQLVLREQKRKTQRIAAIALCVMTAVSLFALYAWNEKFSRWTAVTMYNPIGLFYQKAAEWH